MRLVLLGPPGSGKGVQGAALSRRFSVPAVSTGELLRAGAGTDGADGDERRDVADLQARGELVPDDLVLSVINDALEAVAKGGYILDGFPRTVAQAAHSSAPPVDAAIHIELPDDVVRERIAGRDHGRKDDNPATVERRLRRYHAETEPLLDFYRRKGLLRSVDGAQPPESVTAAILRALEPDG